MHSVCRWASNFRSSIIGLQFHTRGGGGGPGFLSKNNCSPIFQENKLYFDILHKIIIPS